MEPKICYPLEPVAHQNRFLTDKINPAVLDISVQLTHWLEDKAGFIFRTSEEAHNILLGQTWITKRNGLITPLN